MPGTVFLAGAAGAVGRRLAPLLLDAGHRVVGTTRSPARAQSLAEAGVEPVVVDVFDAAALTACVAAARPEIVIHQLTDLPYGLDPAQMEEALVRNARIRVDGTRNLVAAARAAGARRLIAQSIAWLYAPGPEPHTESDPLDTPRPGAVTLDGVLALERQVLEAAPVEGVVLRYGMFYGEGTGSAERSGGPTRVHVDAAAHAALLAIDRARPGIYNVAEPGAYLSSRKARDDLGWSSDYRLVDG
ncbi:MAG: NAD-dependent epimerase/dehydratase family protein [Alphaproteobacteria bacterium]